MECAKCGAAAKKGDGRFCSHCGAAFPDAPRITPHEWVTHPERFDEAEACDEVEQAMNVAAPTVSMLPAVGYVLFLCL